MVMRVDIQAIFLVSLQLFVIDCEVHTGVLKIWNCVVEAANHREPVCVGEHQHESRDDLHE